MKELQSMGDDDAPDQCHLQQLSQGHERFRLASCILSILAKKAPSLPSQLLGSLMMTLRLYRRRRLQTWLQWIRLNFQRLLGSHRSVASTQ